MADFHRRTTPAAVNRAICLCPCVSPANGSVARITLSLRSYMQAKRLLQEEQFELVHLHEPMMPALPLTVHKAHIEVPVVIVP